MTREITPEEAKEVLDSVAQGLTTKTIVDKTASFFPIYLVLLAQKEAPLIHKDPLGKHIGIDQCSDFIRRTHDAPTMVRIARHLGQCSDCYKYFRQVEEG